MRAAQNISGHHKPFVVSNSCMQREREREREQKRRREGERQSRPGQREETEKQGPHERSSGLYRNRMSGLQDKKKKGRGVRAERGDRRGTTGWHTPSKMLVLRPSPRRTGRRGRGEGGRERPKKRKTPPENPQNGENNSLFPVQKPTQNVQPRTIQKHLHHKKRSSCPKTFRKSRRYNKNRTPKNEAKTGRTLLCHFRGPKTMAQDNDNKSFRKRELWKKKKKAPEKKHSISPFNT